MKSFYTAIATMIFSLLIVVPSSIYISHELNVMYNDISMLPQTLSNIPSQDANDVIRDIEALSRKWKSKKRVFEVFISDNEVTYTEMELHNISAYAKSINNSGYSASRGRLLSRIEELSNTVRVSFGTIF